MQMTKEQKSALISAAYIDLEALLQEYRTALIWLTHGRHESNPKQTKQKTLLFMKEIQGKINTVLSDIDTKIQLL
jgi:hypothetical protein